MIDIEIAAASRCGCVRYQNEDMILVGAQFIRDDDFTGHVSVEDDGRYLLAIADGMGGHSSGDVASSDTLHNLQFFFHDIPAGLDAGDFNEKLVDWHESINTFLMSKGRSEEQYQDMGTTLIGLAYYGGNFYSMQCGDSRLYRFRNGELTQLTIDHSLNNLLGVEKHSCILTNCIGGGCTTSYIDIVQLSADVQDQDVYMMCSDGLTDMIDNERIASILAEGGDADALCNAAIEAGGLDNVSVCIARLTLQEAIQN